MGEKTCPTPAKIRFESRDKAAAGRKRGGRRKGGANKGRRMTPYHCPCGGWHLRTQESAGRY